MIIVVPEDKCVLGVHCKGVKHIYMCMYKLKCKMNVHCSSFLNIYYISIKLIFEIKNIIKEKNLDLSVTIPYSKSVCFLNLMLSRFCFLNLMLSRVCFLNLMLSRM